MVSSDQVVIRDGLKPGDIGYLIYLHGWIYAEECGYNHVFEGYVCKTFHEFLDGYNTDKDGFWFAEVNGVMVGAIAVVGRTPEKAQLRWFILHPDYRSLGLGGRLFASALAFCRQKGYRKAYLETTEEQLVAIAMYKKAGFVKVAEHVNHTWGKALVEQTFELDLI